MSDNAIAAQVLSARTGSIGIQLVDQPDLG